MWKKDASCVATLGDYWTANWDDLTGRGWIVFVGVQNDGTFNSFHEEEIGELLAKYIARTTILPRTTSANWGNIFVC